MANLLNEAPDVDDATSDPKGFAVTSFMFMVTVGVVLGLAKAANQIIANRVVGGITSILGGLANLSDTAAEETGNDFPF